MVRLDVGKAGHKAHTLPEVLQRSDAPKIISDPMTAENWKDTFVGEFIYVYIIIIITIIIYIYMYIYNYSYIYYIYTIIYTILIHINP